jgi:hypothetical protein
MISIGYPLTLILSPNWGEERDLHPKTGDVGANLLLSCIGRFLFTRKAQSARSKENLKDAKANFLSLSQRERIKVRD